MATKGFGALDYDVLDLALKSRPLEPSVHSGGAIADRLFLGLGVTRMRHCRVDVVLSPVFCTPHKTDPIVREKNDVALAVATKDHLFVD
jgi:hypothetical protein